jgi:chromosome segregation ATPase
LEETKKRVQSLETELAESRLCLDGTKTRVHDLESQLEERGARLEETCKHVHDLEEAVAAAELQTATEAESGQVRLNALQQQLTVAEAQLAAAQAASHTRGTAKSSQAGSGTDILVQEELNMERAARLKAEASAADASRQAKAQAAAWRQSLQGLKEDQAEILRQWTAASTAWEEERQCLEAEIAQLSARVQGINAADACRRAV